jgi:hypothetical protein
VRLLACLAGVGLVAAAAADPSSGGIRTAQPPSPCAYGWWGDAMVGSYHVHPYKHFDEFNPGLGGECGFARTWAAAFGYYRNSLDRPSFYGGAIWTPLALDWRWARLGIMGGVISGYNYGRYGFGSDQRTGPVVAPTIITGFRRFGANFILVPPIPADNLPFTVGLQVKWRFD